MANFLAAAILILLSLGDLCADHIHCWCLELGVRRSLLDLLVLWVMKMKK
ncbi:hypothetical protein [Vibrio sp. ED002]|nr:hypothetical protein [Vibrio sp. ED002]UQA51683.1 hypothetical protein ITG12_04960 [Vibrio sp. ED002]